MALLSVRTTPCRTFDHGSHASRKHRRYPVSGLPPKRSGLITSRGTWDKGALAGSPMGTGVARPRRTFEICNVSRPVRLFPLTRPASKAKDFDGMLQRGIRTAAYEL